MSELRNTEQDLPGTFKAFVGKFAAVGEALLAMNTCGFPRTVMAWPWARRRIEQGGAPVR